MSSSIPVSEDGCKETTHDFNVYFSAVCQNLVNDIYRVGDVMVRDSDYTINTDFIDFLPTTTYFVDVHLLFYVTRLNFYNCLFLNEDTEI